MSHLVVDKLTLENSIDSRKLRKPNFKWVCRQKTVERLTWFLFGYSSWIFVFLLSRFWFLKWYVAFWSWQVDFEKFYRLWMLEKSKFQMGVSPKDSWMVDMVYFQLFFMSVLIFLSRDSDSGKCTSRLTVDKLTFEKSRDSRKLRRPNFKIGVSPRVVEWLTQEVSQGSRK